MAERDDPLAAEHVGDRAGERRRQRDRQRAGGHDVADLRRPGVEFTRQFRQQRLRRIEMEKGAAAGDGDAEAPVVESHFARGHGWKRGRIMREADAAHIPWFCLARLSAAHGSHPRRSACPGESLPRT